MSIDIIVSPYSDPMDGLDWHEQEIVPKLKAYLEKFDGPKAHFVIAEKTLPAGADWPVVVVTIVTLGSAAFLGIADARKKLRESIQEWKGIRNDFARLTSWIGRKAPIVSFSIDVCFFDALDRLIEDDGVDLDTLESVSADAIDIDLRDNPAHKIYKFVFIDEARKYSIVISDLREVHQYSVQER